MLLKSDWEIILPKGSGNHQSGILVFFFFLLFLLKQSLRLHTK